MQPPRVSVEIGATPEDVFACVADVVRHGEWANANSKLGVTHVSGEAVGATYRSTQRFFGRAASADITVAEAQPPSRLVLDVVQNGQRFVHTYTFRASSAGTVVEHTTESPEAKALQKIVGAIAMPAIRADMRKSLRNLKAKLERR